MRDILMIVHTAGSLKCSDNDRFTYLARKLAEIGNSHIEIVTSDFEHHKKKYRENIDRFPFKITFLHEKKYKKNVSIQRICGHISFSKELKKYLCTRKKPDVIYLAVPPLISAKVVAKYANKNNIKLVIDVQDLWPESFKMILGDSAIVKTLLYPLQRIADEIYNRANVVFSVSDTFFNYIMGKRIHECRGGGVYLGVDAERVKVGSTLYQKKMSEFWLAYVGNLGSSYDFDSVFEALDKLQSKNIKNITFVIIGDGDRRNELKIKAKERNIGIIITGYLPYEEMFNILSNADIAINPIIKTSVSSVVNKVGDYAAAGIPVINTQNSPEYRNLLTEYNAGINSIPEDAESIANAIETLYLDEKKRKNMGINNKKLFEAKFNRRNSYKLIIDELV